MSTHTEADYANTAGLFKALGHPLRVKIVCGLLREPCTQTHIAASLGIPQSSIAQHIDVLRRKGIVEGTRDGTELILTVRDDRVPGILRAACREDSLPAIDWKAERAAQGTPPRQ